MRSPDRPRHSTFSTVMFATIPMVLAAITVLMFQGALAHDDSRTSSTLSAPFSLRR